jgi:hypothetical protein
VGNDKLDKREVATSWVLKSVCLAGWCGSLLCLVDQHPLQFPHPPRTWSPSLPSPFSSSGSSWESNRELISVDAEEALHLLSTSVSLEELSATFKQMKAGPAIAGRVVEKSQVLYFPTLTDGRAFPFHAYFVLSDGTATVPLVLWYSCCHDYFSSIRVGDLVAITGYRPRAITSFSSIYAPDASIELSLNSRQPEAKIHLLEAGISPELDALPLFPLPFLSVAELLDGKEEHAEDPLHCNVVVRLVHVGRVEVDRYKRSIFAYRWLSVRDDSTSTGMLFKLYGGQQYPELLGLQAGQLLLCTNVRLHVHIVNSRVTLTHLQTTKTSYFTPAAPTSLAFDSIPIGPRLSALLSWVIHADESLLLLQDGLVQYPPPSAQLMRPALSPTPLATLASVLSEMRHLERMQMVVQGVIVALALVDPFASGTTWLPLAELAESRSDAPATKRSRNHRRPASKKREFGPGMGVTMTLFDSDQAPLSPSIDFISPTLPSDGTAVASQGDEPERAYDLLWMVGIRGLNGDAAVEAYAPDVHCTRTQPRLPPLLAGRTLGSEVLIGDTLAQQVLARATEWNGARMVFVLDLFRHGAHYEVTLNRFARAEALA